MAALFQFENYLEQLKNEITAFPDDSSLWMLPEGINNTPGNLAMHIAGNLQHFIGAILGKTGYVRQRELEFSVKGLTKEQVISELNTARVVVVTVVGSMNTKDKTQNYPSDFKGKILSVEDALSHLLAHLAYHTGQINYLRRIIIKSS